MNNPNDNSFLASERKDAGNAQDVLAKMYPACPICSGRGCDKCHLGIMDREDFEAWQDKNGVVDDIPNI